MTDPTPKQTALSRAVIELIAVVGIAETSAEIDRIAAILRNPMRPRFPDPLSEAALRGGAERHRGPRDHGSIINPLDDEDMPAPTGTVAETVSQLLRAGQGEAAVTDGLRPQPVYRDREAVAEAFGLRGLPNVNPNFDGLAG